MMGVSLYGKLNNLKRKRKKCVTHAAVSEISDVVSLSFVGLTSYMTDVMKAYATRN